VRCRGLDRQAHFPFAIWKKQYPWTLMSLGASEWSGDTPLGIRLQSFALTWTGKRAPGAVAMRRDGSALLRYTSYRILTFACIQRRYLGRRVLQSPFSLNLTGTSHAQGAWNVSWPASNGSAGTLRKPWPWPSPLVGRLPRRQRIS